MPPGLSALPGTQAGTLSKDTAVGPGAAAETTENRMFPLQGWHLCTSTREKSIACKSRAVAWQGWRHTAQQSTRTGAQDAAAALLSQHGTPRLQFRVKVCEHVVATSQEPSGVSEQHCTATVFPEGRWCWGEAGEEPCSGLPAESSTAQQQLRRESRTLGAGESPD